MSARKKAYLALLLNAVLWGIAPPLAKLALAHTSPFHWLFYRFLFAAIISLPLLIWLLLKHRPQLKQILLIIGLELIGTTAVLSTFYLGLELTTATETALISQAAPIFVILGGILFLREREEKHEWIGLTLAIAGTTVLTLEPITTNASPWGNLLILTQDLLWAGYLIAAKRLYRPISKLLVSSISFWVGLVTFFPLTFLEAPASSLFTDLTIPIVLTSSLYMATFGSIIAATLYIYGQNLIEASEATLFTYLQPLISLPLAAFWLKDRLTPTTIISGLVIAVGVYLAERRPKKLVASG